MHWVNVMAGFRFFEVMFICGHEFRVGIDPPGMTKNKRTPHFVGLVGELNEEMIRSLKESGIW